MPFPLHKKEPVQSNHYHHVLCRSLHLIANTPLGQVDESSVVSAEPFCCLCLAHSAWPIGLLFYFYFSLCITIPEMDMFQVIWHVHSSSWLFYYFQWNVFCTASFAHHNKNQSTSIFFWQVKKVWQFCIQDWMWVKWHCAELLWKRSAQNIPQTLIFQFQRDFPKNWAVADSTVHHF